MGDARLRTKLELCTVGAMVASQQCPILPKLCEGVHWQHGEVWREKVPRARDPTESVASQKIGRTSTLAFHSPLEQQAFQHALEDLIAAFASLNLRDCRNTNALLRCGWPGRKITSGLCGKASTGGVVKSGEKRTSGTRSQRVDCESQDWMHEHTGFPFPFGAANFSARA